MFCLTKVCGHRLIHDDRDIRVQQLVGQLKVRLVRGCDDSRIQIQIQKNIQLRNDVCGWVSFTSLDLTSGISHQDGRHCQIRLRGNDRCVKSGTSQPVADDAQSERRIHTPTLAKLRAKDRTVPLSNRLTHPQDIPSRHSLTYRLTLKLGGNTFR